MPNSKKKVVIITQALGGVKTHILHILNYSDRNKYEFVIIGPFDQDFQAISQKYALHYHIIDFVRDFNVFKDFKALWSITKILKKERPEIVHTHSAKGGFIGRLAARLSGTNKTIYTPNGLAYLSFTGIKRMLFYYLEYIAVKWTNIYLAVAYSEANRANIELGYKTDNIIVNLNAIPVPEYFVKNYDTVKHIGMIARLTYQKNPLLYLEVVKRVTEIHPEVKFSILGSGLQDHLRNDVHDFIKTNNIEDKIEIIPWGVLGTSENYLDSIDIFLMTSAFEGLPYSLLEAMSKGIPCIVTKVDGNSDVIQNSENGFSCLSADEFVERIEYLLNSSEVRSTIGTRGFDYVTSKHNILENVRSLQKVYDDM